MLNILYISHESNSIGGSTKSLMNMINSVKGRVHPIVVLPNSGMPLKYFEDAGIECVIVPFKLSFTDKKGWKRFLITIPRIATDYIKNLRAQQQIRAVVKNRKISIVHSNSSAIQFGQSLAKKINAKHVLHLREFLSLDFGFSPVVGWKVFRRKISRADLIIGITKSVYNHYRLEGNEKAYVLFNAVRPYSKTKFKKVKENYILFCGAVTKGKGIEDALRAFSLIHQKYPYIKFLIAGSCKTTYHHHLEALIKELKLEQSVHFLGFQADVDDLMANAICLLMCSKNEALGRVTVEAMFNGCPVVGYASAGTNELIEDNETGLLYRTIDQLAEKVCYLIKEKDDALQLISKAQDFARMNFSEEQFAEKLLRLYKKVIA